jgi:hypothetical protein
MFHLFLRSHRVLRKHPSRLYLVLRYTAVRPLVILSGCILSFNNFLIPCLHPLIYSVQFINLLSPILRFRSNMLNSDPFFYLRHSCLMPDSL